MELEALRVDSVDAKIKQTIFIVYILLIVEGVLRKWILPGLSSPLFFIKDPFIVYTYFLNYYYRRNLNQPLFNVIIIFCFWFLILMCFQTFLYNYDIIIGMYGWRNYCMYAPLAFIIGKYFHEREMIIIGKITCLASIPNAILGFIQYSSSPSDYINKNVGGSTAEIFTVAAGVVRPSGTFSFTSGYTLFITCLCLFLLYNYFLGKKRFLKAWQFYLCIASFFTCLAVSGSRAAYFSIILIAIFLVFSSLFLMRKKQGFKIILSTFLMAIVGIIMFTYVFDKQWEIISQRQLAAQSYEGSIWNRIFSVFLSADFLLFSNLSLLGTGIGLGSGGGGYLSTGSAGFVLAENEWERHILECGLLTGFFYIIYRVSLAFNVIKNAVSGLFVSSNPVPLLFASFIVPNILVGPITGNGVSYAFTWIFLGMSFAINKVYNKL